jgi:hypothetical protein
MNRRDATTGFSIWALRNGPPRTRNVHAILTDTPDADRPSFTLNRLVVVAAGSHGPGLCGMGCATEGFGPLPFARAIKKHLKPFLIGKAGQISPLWQLMNASPLWRSGRWLPTFSKFARTTICLVTFARFPSGLKPCVRSVAIDWHLTKDIQGELPPMDIINYRFPSRASKSSRFRSVPKRSISWHAAGQGGHMYLNSTQVSVDGSRLRS